MNNLDTALANCWKASEELENAARMMASDSKAELSLYDSRLLRDRIADCQIRTSRAERSILEVPIVQAARQAEK